MDCLWLQPMYPSPFRDDGYDISDYTNIHPNYGTLQDFQTFLNQRARARAARDHRARPESHVGSARRGFVEARSSTRQPAPRLGTSGATPTIAIVASGSSSSIPSCSNWAWDPVSKAYYWHRFFSHQPDLNYDNPAVREAIWQVMKFWLDLGVDGFRVDAVPYLVEREGTSCENLPETHAVLKELRARLDAHFTGKLLLAEANMWPEDVRPYFGDGRRVPHVVPLPDHAPHVHGASARGSQAAASTSSSGRRAFPTPASGDLFLRNHDELTLEMVTRDRTRVHVG